MNKRLVVDPITRIEGHLRIEAQMNGSTIAEAYSSGTMVRGIEIILQGRDPRDAWAFVQRICGVCTLVHGIEGVNRPKANHSCQRFLLRESFIEFNPQHVIGTFQPDGVVRGLPVSVVIDPNRCTN